MDKRQKALDVLNKKNINASFSHSDRGYAIFNNASDNSNGDWDEISYYLGYHSTDDDGKINIDCTWFNIDIDIDVFLAVADLIKADREEKKKAK